MKLITQILALIIFFMSFAMADEDNNQKDEAKNDTKVRGLEYPGQISQDSEGNKIKNWSTRGPVRVNNAPQPFSNQGNSSLPNGTFINVLPKNNGYPNSQNR